MRKKRGKQYIGIFLLIGGLFLISLPTTTSWIINQKSSQNVDQVKELPAEVLQENLSREGTFNFEDIAEISTSSITSKKPDPDFLIGHLTIPKVGIDMPVYNGVTNEILNVGIGTMRQGVKMGEGNFPIAGHYSRRGTLFEKLNDVQIGDSIFLTDNENTYEYIAYDIKVVQPTDIRWIYDKVADDRGKPVISLMNCYYVNGRKQGDQRYFVFGELEKIHQHSD